MRRTDLSRKMGKAISVIEQGVLVGESFDIKTITSIVKNELDLRPSKPIETLNSTTVNFKDYEFEGTLKKSDIYVGDSEARDLGVKDIRNICGIVQIRYFTDKVELNLIVEAEYTDNQGKKHKTFATLKNLRVLLSNNIKDDDVTQGLVESEEVAPDLAPEDIEDIKEEIAVAEETKSYKDYIGDAITNLFSKRFFGSVPSDEFKNIIIDKIHNIYVVNYLEQLYTNDSIDDESGEGIQVIKRILDTL